MKPLLLLIALTCFSFPAFAEIQIEKGQAYETADGMRNGAVFLTIINDGKDADKLIAAASSAADKIEIHVMSESNGVMQMRMADNVPVGAHQTVILKPDGYHLMLMGLRTPLKAGTALPLSLQFERAGKFETTFIVVPASGHHQTSPMDH